VVLEPYHSSKALDHLLVPSYHTIILMPARLSKRQQRELEELTHTNEIEQAGISSRDEDMQFASVSTQSAFAAVSQDALLKIVQRFTTDKSF